LGNSVSKTLANLLSVLLPPIHIERPADMTEIPNEMKLIRMMAHALRHNPAKSDLEPDGVGWVSLDDLLIAIRYERLEWMGMDLDDIVEILAVKESDRF